jgi:hypothetical protein
VEIAIQRGRALREIFKQDRLEPLPIEFQMAWLVAFNDRRFDAIEPEDIPGRLKTLESRVSASGFTLDSPREQWGLGCGRLACRRSHGMTRRRTLKQRRDSFGEIRNIMNSMKTLAYLEICKLGRFLDAQRAVVAHVETVAADYLGFHSDLLPPPDGSAQPVCLLLGHGAGETGNQSRG